MNEKELLEEIRQFLTDHKRGHYNCDDPYYNCPAFKEYKDEEWDEEDIQQGFHDCECGADDYNKKVDKLIEKINKFIE